MFVEVGRELVGGGQVRDPEDAKGVVDAWHHEKQRDPRVLGDPAKAVESVVAEPLRQQKRVVIKVETI